MPSIPSPLFATTLYAQLTVTNATQWDDPEVVAALEATIDALITTPPVAQNVPQGPPLPPEETTEPFADGPTTVERLQAAYGALRPGQVHLTLLGETHADQDDVDRANAVLEATDEDEGSLAPALIVFERGLPYEASGFSGPTAREDSLTEVPQARFGLGLSATQRSMVIAAYLVLALARGDQSEATPVLIFFGENHADILTYFETFAARPTSQWLVKRPRTLLIERSSQ